MLALRKTNTPSVLKRVSVIAEPDFLKSCDHNSCVVNELSLFAVRNYFGNIKVMEEKYGRKNLGIVIS